MGFVIGVDGGSKTTAAVVAEDLQVLGRSTAGSTNAHSVGEDEACANLCDVITEVLDYARLSLGEIAAIGLCLDGFESEYDRPVPREALRRLGYTGVAVLENDVVGAWAGATQMQPGVVVVSGTGSTALGMNRRGQFRRTDGWGHMLGDAGSGYDIGRAGIRLAMKAFEGRAAPTLLTEALKAIYGVADADEMKRLVDAGPFDKLEIASFARQVAKAAEAGDGAGRAILSQAGRELAEQALAVVYSLRMAEEEFLVATVGEVFRSDRWVQEPFQHWIRQRTPQAVFRAPLHPPEMGAAILAFRRLESGDFGSWTLGTGRQRIERTEPLL